MRAETASSVRPSVIMTCSVSGLTSMTCADPAVRPQVTDLLRELSWSSRDS
jgi:hypothetical protein